MNWELYETSLWYVTILFVFAIITDEQMPYRKKLENQSQLLPQPPPPALKYWKGWNNMHMCARYNLQPPRSPVMPQVQKTSLQITSQPIFPSSMLLRKFSFWNQFLQVHLPTQVETDDKKSWKCSCSTAPQWNIEYIRNYKLTVRNEWVDAQLAKYVRINSATFWLFINVMYFTYINSPIAEIVFQQCVRWLLFLTN